MKNIADFWKKDIINKLILLVITGIVISFFIVLYFFLSMPKDSIFYATFFSGDKGGVPTLSIAPITETPPNTPTTIYFPSMTPFASLTPTFALFPTLALPTSTALPAQPTNTPSPAPTNLSPLAVCIPTDPAKIQTGAVLDVLDGNTIKVYLDGKVYVVRYIGIAVPKYGEFKAPFGQASQAKNSKLVFGKTITLVKDTSDKDSVGHLLRYVISNGVFVNLEMLQTGLATALDVPPDSACAKTFKDAEQAASQAKIGLWSATPTPTH